MIIPNDKKGTQLNTSATRYNIIPPKNDPSDEFKDCFLFIEESNKTDFLDCIRIGSHNKLPSLFTRITYKNILGTCFGITHGYFLDAKTEEQDILLGYYQSTAKTYPIEFKNELGQLRRLRLAKNDEGWDNLFKQVKEKVDQKNGPPVIELRWLERPDVFGFEILDIESFKREQNQANYGHPVPMMQHECPASKTMQKSMPAGAEE